ncbi:hypothetical protein TNIN_385561 [Trichonephila inaurata madagascariensis]|uniref:Uncharacterized protein n=1 Tax=Trichonephila inaurata madagascariensis TaxID=2747483 RepID=A0A8X6WVK4_9ARAC|nr:hypothetical protein TNIN_385561 [Trichonephila inaurata madagascariensis]
MVGVIKGCGKIYSIGCESRQDMSGHFIGFRIGIEFANCMVKSGKASFVSGAAVVNEGNRNYYCLMDRRLKAYPVVVAIEIENLGSKGVGLSIQGRLSRE